MEKESRKEIKEKVKLSKKLIKEKENGITLIALIVTIIILLILAGVTIATLTGENGIITRANEAKTKTEEAAKKEQEDLDNLALQMDMQEKGEIANTPELKENMIPVKWDGESWAKADKNNSNKDWYDYNTNSKKWANVVTVKESGTKTREEYKNAQVGTKIAEEDITTMFVWIPRYSYKITSGYHENANGTGNIEIKFLLGTTDSFVDGGGDAVRSSESNKNFVVHPAFTEDTSLGGVGKEITGFWVGKFEASNSEAAINNEGYTNDTDSNTLFGGGNVTNKSVTIRPNVTSWRAIDVNNIYTVCKAMNANGNIHGFGNDIDTMMMKNSQWGAVAYLAQSDYGNKQVSTDSSSGIWNNPYTEGFTLSANNEYKMDNSSTGLTGMAGESRDTNTNFYSKLVEGSKKVNADESIEISYTNINTGGTEGSQFTRKFYHYDSENGQKASTTRNIYGIYDMSGGSWEYMASYLEEGTTSYVQNFLKLDEKYQTRYKGNGETSSTADRTINYEANKGIYGDAVWETSNGCNGQYSWNADYSGIPYLSYPFFLRGGLFNHSTAAGVFCFSSTTGVTHNNCGFRCVAL